MTMNLAPQVGLAMVAQVGKNGDVIAIKQYHSLFARRQCFRRARLRSDSRNFIAAENTACKS
jgi:hypothetical protein